MATEVVGWRSATGSVHRCEQMLQKPSCVCSVSSIDGSSQPHLGQRSRRHRHRHRPSTIAHRRSVDRHSPSAAAMASPGFAPQAIDVHQAEPDPAVRLDAAQPVRHLHVDRREADAVALRILHQRRRVVEPHRLVVEHRRVERRRVVRLQIGARVDQQREARRVRLGEAVERERRDRADDLLRGVAGDPLPLPSRRAASPRSAASASRIA